MRLGCAAFSSRVARGTGLWGGAAAQLPTGVRRSLASAYFEDEKEGEDERRIRYSFPGRMMAMTTESV